MAATNIKFTLVHYIQEISGKFPPNLLKPEGISDAGAAILVDFEDGRGGIPAEGLAESGHDLAPSKLCHGGSNCCNANERLVTFSRPNYR